MVANLKRDMDQDMKKKLEEEREHMKEEVEKMLQEKMLLSWLECNRFSLILTSQTSILFASRIVSLVDYLEEKIKDDFFSKKEEYSIFKKNTAYVKMENGELENDEFDKRLGEIPNVTFTNSYSEESSAVSYPKDFNLSSLNEALARDRSKMTSVNEKYMNNERLGELENLPK
ncbi:hypothetical protein BC332_15228 [Capsicum chinense]|nr:hypothetical protein BC332_15228 [Capsicum chinense]